jgi:acetylornithine deacetylase/succinyl-diaminopimelate desuccinylase-like protein
MTATELLSELLRTETVNPPGAEMPAARIYESFLQDAGLETKILESPAGRPNLVARLEGSSDEGPLVLLSHTDVVGVERDKWQRDPFSGEVADGAIWGRGALDMKGVGVMHADAVAELARSSSAVRRTVIFVAVADEEAGGKEGAAWLVEEHPELVGLGGRGGSAPEVLGEGAFGLSGLLPRPLMPIVLGEKSVLWLDLKATGTPGHGALPPLEQAPANLAKAITKVAGFGPPRVHPVMQEQFAALARESEGVSGAVFKLLASGAGKTVAAALKSQLRARGTIATLISDTATPTQLAAGYKHNVVPGSATASLDCRLLPDTHPDDYTAAMQKKVASLGVTAERVAHYGSPVSKQGPLFEILAQESDTLPERPIVVPSLTSAMTDVRFWRQRGAHGYGWVPLVVGPELLGTIHGHDERVPVDAFERAVESMTRVVARAAARSSPATAFPITRS